MEHSTRIKWLIREGKIEKEIRISYDDLNITIDIMLDEMAYQRYLKEFEPQLFYKER